MEPSDLAKKIASGSWENSHVIAALAFDSEQTRQFSVAVMQRASQFSDIQIEATEVPLNSETAFSVRKNAFGFVADVVTAIEEEAGSIAGEVKTELIQAHSQRKARWNVRFAEYARRFEESKIEKRLSFGDINEAKQKFCAFGGILATVAENPREAAQKALAITAEQGNYMDRDTRMLLGYEQAYWLQLDGKFAEAKQAHTQHALACRDAGDNLGWAIFTMQAAKAGLDGKLEHASEDLVGAHEDVLEALQEKREHPLAKQWLEKTMPDHIGQAVQPNGQVSARAEKLKESIGLAREGRFEVPNMGSM